MLESEGAKLSNIQYNEYDYRKQYTVTVKVNPNKFDNINEQLKSIGEVKDLSVILEDVTTQYVEIDVRIDSREIELQRLYALYNMSDDVQDLLDIEREITRVETELEILKQQQQRLISKVEHSTISITIYEDKPSTEQLTVPLEELGAVFFGALAVAITILVALSGFILPIVLVVGVLWFVYRKLRGKGKKAKPRQSQHDRIPSQR
jgi:Flp pilus assembly protein TadB